MKLLIAIATVLLVFSTGAKSAVVSGFDVGALGVIQVAEPSCKRVKSKDPACGNGVLFEMAHSTAADTLWRHDSPVLGVVVNGQAVAYPVAMLLWHWVINDEVGGQPIVVAFCRICGSGGVYRRTVGGDVLNFGTSGLIYDRDMLLYDEQSLTLWSWGSQSAVAGPLRHSTLELLVSNQQTLADWLELHPESLIASGGAAGLKANSGGYQVTPNGNSALGDSVYSGLERTVGQLPSAMPVLLVSINNESIAFPASEVLAVKQVNMTGENGAFTLEFDAATQKFSIEGEYKGERMRLVELFVRHPEAGVFQADQAVLGDAK